MSPTALVIAGICLAVLSVLSHRGVSSISPYIVVGAIMWIAVLKSGVHATLAGVALAAFIPMQSKEEPGRSPLHELEHDLHPVVAYLILPLFAFANAGVPLDNVSLDFVLHPVPLGIALGLFLGKQLGIFTACLIAIKTGVASLPAGSSWGSLYGISILCGVGFTMSMFIGSLAFESAGMDVHGLFDDRLGTIIGSLLSAIFAWLVLQLTLPRKA
jgi:NhaA family Na+:H+ antiporter